MSGRVVEWSPPRRFSCTWLIEGMPEFRELPVCLVTYEIEQPGAAVKLTMTEAHSWDIPDAILQGGRTGWPAILSSLKSVLETGKPLDVKLAPPEGMVEAVKKAVAERPWEASRIRVPREAGSASRRAWRGRDEARSYRKLALNFSSTAEPGHSSFSPSELSGATTVERLPCRSSGSLST